MKNYKRLTAQAFNLFHHLRIQRFDPLTTSVRRERLHALMFRAYLRYERRQLMGFRYE